MNKLIIEDMDGALLELEPNDEPSGDYKGSLCITSRESSYHQHGVEVDITRDQAIEIYNYLRAFITGDPIKNTIPMGNVKTKTFTVNLDK